MKNYMVKEFQRDTKELLYYKYHDNKADMLKHMSAIIDYNKENNKDNLVIGYELK